MSCMAAIEKGKLTSVFIAGQHVTPGTVNSLKDGHLWDQH